MSTRKKRASLAIVLVSFLRAHFLKNSWMFTTKVEDIYRVNLSSEGKESTFK